MPTMESTTFNGLYCLFKGEPGTRKSTQALVFPGPQYWFSWDRKMNGIYLPMRKWGIDPKTIYVSMTTMIGLHQVRSWSSYRYHVHTRLYHRFHHSMADMTLRQTTRLKYGVTRQSGAQAGKLIAGIAVNEIEDYNAESAAFRN